MKKLSARRPLWLVGILGLMLMATSCVPREAIQFRTMRNITIDASATGEPLLKAEAVLYNPNRLRMKLKEVKMEILVDGKKSAYIDQKPNLKIPAQAEFPVYVEARLALQEQGLLNTVMSLFGGKKYEVQYLGYVRVRVHGIGFKVPVNFTDQLRIK